MWAPKLPLFGGFTTTCDLRSSKLNELLTNKQNFLLLRRVAYITSKRGEIWPTNDLVANI